MIVIGIDPGLVTGVAVLDTTAAPVIVAVEEIPGRAAVGKWLYLQLARRLDAIACERYVLTPGVRTAQPDALMIMGTVEYLADQYSVPFSWQYPGPAKKMCPDALLKKLSCYTRTKDGHANDAARHCLHWLALNSPEAYAAITGV